MECKGELKQILGKDGQNLNVLLSLTDTNPESLNDLFNQELSVRLTKYHPKRSLDANSYCWVILSKLAEKLNTSKEELYEFKLRQYGVPYEDETGRHVVVAIKSDIPQKELPGHWLWLKDTNGASNYMKIKGTSEYDSAEMAHFIDMIVQDAKDMGIETLTPKQLEEMKNEWNQYCNRKKSATSAEPQST